MIKSDKKLRELALLLEKDSPALVSDAIEMLRNEEPFEGAVSLLASCYGKSSSVLVKKAVENFFNDLKNKELRSEIVGEIKKDRDPATKTMLVSSCWQSGLDYTDYVTHFARIFLESDYATALECFTVIEGSIPELNRSEKEKITGLLRDNHQADVAKKSLLLELLSLLES